MKFLWRCYVVLCSIFVWQVLFAENAHLRDKLDSEEKVRQALTPLNKVCIENSGQQIIPFYLLCFYRSVFQINYDFKSNAVTETNVLGHYNENESSGSVQVYYSPDENCKNDDLSVNSTKVTVKIECCVENNDEKSIPSVSGLTGAARNSKAYISTVSQYDACHYHIMVCSPLICADQTMFQTDIAVVHPPVTRKELVFDVSKEDQEDLKNRTKEMFLHAYHSYMENAFPHVSERFSLYLYQINNFLLRTG